MIILFGVLRNSFSAWLALLRVCDLAHEDLDQCQEHLVDNFKSILLDMFLSALLVIIKIFSIFLFIQVNFIEWLIKAESALEFF